MFARDRSLSDSRPIDFKQLLSLRNLLTLRSLINTDTDTDTGTVKSAANAAVKGLVLHCAFCLPSVTSTKTQKIGISSSTSIRVSVDINSKSTGDSNAFCDELPRCEPL